MKILAVIHNGNQTFYSLDEKPKLTYEKHGSLLIGSDEDGIFYDVLILNYDAYSKAFGGREFDLPMKDGTTTHCNGQYWDGGHGDAEKLLGITLGHVGAKAKVELQKCYVYCSYHVDVGKFNNLICESNPEVFQGDDAYYDYERKINYEKLLQEFFRKHKSINRQETIDFMSKYGYAKFRKRRYGKSIDCKERLSAFAGIVYKYGREENMSNNARKRYGLPLKRRFSHDFKSYSKR